MGEPERVETTVGERAGGVSRFAAFLADAVIVAIGLRTTLWLLHALPRVLWRFAPPVNLTRIFVALVPFIVGAYNVAFWTVLGQTPGKWLMGLKVVPTAGGRMTLKRSLVRLVGYLVSALPVYVGFLWILGPRRRGWHDLLAGTEVTYVRRRPAPSGITAASVRDRMREPVRRPVLSRPPGPAAKADASS
jgi:uncharacterized RDD family membrane protein YckC